MFIRHETFFKQFLTYFTIFFVNGVNEKQQNNIKTNNLFKVNKRL